MMKSIARRMWLVKQQSWITTGLFLTVTGVFWILRSTFHAYIRDDWDNIAWLNEKPLNLLWGTPGSIANAFDSAFGYAWSRGFSQVIRIVGAAYLTSDHAHAPLYFLLVAMLIGLTAVCMYWVARRFVSSTAAAVFSAMLFIFSPPFVQASWVVVAGIQTFIPLFICLGLLLYWKITEDPSTSWFIKLAFVLTLVIGPFFREFIGLLQVLIILSEIVRSPKKPTWILGVAIVTLLNGIYPTFLLHYTIYPDLAIESIFENGSLGSTLQQVPVSNAWVDRLLSHFHHLFLTLGTAFIPLLPPSIFICVGATMLWDCVRAWIKRLRPNTMYEECAQVWQRCIVPMHLGAILVALYYYLYTRSDNSLNSFSMLTCLLLPVYILPVSPLLAVWFLLSYLPFLRVFTMQTHLLYVVLPASIICAHAVQNLYMRFNGSHWGMQSARLILVAGICMWSIEGCFTVYGSYKTVHGIEDGLQAVAAGLSHYVPQGSIVAFNSAQGLEIAGTINGHFIPYMMQMQGRNPEDLKKLLDDNFDKKPIYFLDMRQDHCFGKYWGHGHAWVDYEVADIKKIATLHKTQVFYPYVDPLASYVSCLNTPFLGAPDALAEFYHGPTSTNTLFVREVHVQYDLYRVLSKKVDLRPIGGERFAFDEVYKQFRIWHYGSRYFADAELNTPFTDRWALQHRYSPSVRANTLDDIRHKIDDYRAGKQFG